MLTFSTQADQRDDRFDRPSSPSSTASYHSLDDDEPTPLKIPRDKESARDLQTLLAGGSCVRSYEGTSQYAQRGISSCGIASFNAIRTVFDLESRGYRCLDLILMMMTRDIVDKTVEICSSWTSAAHLEAEDIHDMPLFRQALNIIENEYEQAREANFSRILRRLRDLARPGRSAAAVITKPPEIITIFAVATGEPSRPVVFVIFDSHSRPNVHPLGAGFIFFGSLTDASRYLTQLLSVDPAVLRESGMQWEAQLLSQYTAHYIVAAVDVPTRNSILYEANIALLDVKPSMSALQDRMEESSNENSSLKAEIALLKEQINEFRHDRERLYKEHKSMEKELKAVQNAQNRSPTSFKDDYQPPIDRERRRKDKGKGKGKDLYPADDLPPSPPPMPRPREEGKKPRPTSTATATQSHPGRDYRNSTGSGGSWGAFGANAITPPDRQSKPPLYQKARFSYDIPSPSISSHATDSSDFSKSRDPPQHFGGHHQFDEDHLLALRLQHELQQQDLRDAMLAASIQADFDAENNRLRDERTHVLSSAVLTFDCVICMETHPEDSVARIDSCGHQYCRSCLHSHLTTSLQEGNFPIRCPVCASNSRGRDVAVVSRQLAEQLGLTEEESQTWWKYELTKLVVSLECHKCKRTAMVDKGDHDAAELITCPYRDCGFVFCKKCSQEVVKGDASQHSCDGTKELDALTRTHGWKHCPGCGALVEKTEGCNHMTCRTPGCNTHFDYASGGRMR